MWMMLTAVPVTTSRKNLSRETWSGKLEGPLQSTSSWFFSIPLESRILCVLACGVFFRVFRYSIHRNGVWERNHA